MNDNEITVLKVLPGQAPETVTIRDTLEELQKEVGGYIEAIYPFDDQVCIICNEEGKVRSLPLNRALVDENGEVCDVIAGTFLVVGLAGEDFTSLSGEQLSKYREMYAKPQLFYRQGGKLKMFSEEIVARLEAHKKDELHPEPER